MLEEEKIEMADLLRMLQSKLEEHVAMAQYHASEAQKLTIMLNTYNSNATVGTVKKDANLFSSTLDLNIFTTSGDRRTFIQIIVDMFSDGQPKTTRMLYNEFLKNGHTVKNVKDFSTKLSIRAKHGDIKNVKLDEYPVGLKYWWGLSIWFYSDQTMKEEFLAKIHAKVKDDTPSIKSSAHLMYSGHK